MRHQRSYLWYRTQNTAAIRIALSRMDKRCCVRNKRKKYFDWQCGKRNGNSNLLMSSTALSIWVYWQAPAMTAKMVKVNNIDSIRICFSVNFRRYCATFCSVILPHVLLWMDRKSKDAKAKWTGRETWKWNDGRSQMWCTVLLCACSSHFTHLANLSDTRLLPENRWCEVNGSSVPFCNAHKNPSSWILVVVVVVVYISLFRQCPNTNNTTIAITITTFRFAFVAALKPK